MDTQEAAHGPIVHVNRMLLRSSLASVRKDHPQLRTTTIAAEIETSAKRASCKHRRLYTSNNASGTRYLPPCRPTDDEMEKRVGTRESHRELVAKKKQKDQEETMENKAPKERRERE